jgi:hypothetical protein
MSQYHELSMTQARLSDHHETGSQGLKPHSSAYQELDVQSIAETEPTPAATLSVAPTTRAPPAPIQSDDTQALAPIIAKAKYSHQSESREQVSCFTGEKLTVLIPTPTKDGLVKVMRADGTTGLIPLDALRMPEGASDQGLTAAPPQSKEHKQSSAPAGECQLLRVTQAKPATVCC